jgi:hypothetical protein
MLWPRQAINAEDHHAIRPDCVDPAPRNRAPHVSHEEDPDWCYGGIGPGAYLRTRLTKVLYAFASRNSRWRITPDWPALRPRSPIGR